MSSIHEKDWKLLRAMQEEKLNQACEEILGKIEIEIKCKKEEKHKAYLKVWDIVNSGDKVIGTMFNDLRRSNAIWKLASWKSNGLLTDIELESFSEETRSSIEVIASV